MSTHGDLQHFFKRDLEQLIEELKMYPNEESLWKVLPGTANSGGNLFLHLIGNLRHFLVKGMLNTDFQRDREAEFADSNIPRSVLMEELTKVLDEVVSSLETLQGPDDLNKEFGITWRGKSPSVHFMLMQLLVHLHYHMGQINYHRRFFSTQ